LFGLNFWQFLKKKFYIKPPVSDFVFLKIYFMLDGLILFRKGDFHFKVCPWGGFYKGGILGGVSVMGAIPKTVQPYCLIPWPGGICLTHMP